MTARRLVLEAAGKPSGDGLSSVPSDTLSELADAVGAWQRSQDMSSRPPTDRKRADPSPREIGAETKLDRKVSKRAAKLENVETMRTKVWEAIEAAGEGWVSSAQIQKKTKLDGDKVRRAVYHWILEGCVTNNGGKAHGVAYQAGTPSKALIALASKAIGPASKLAKAKANAATAAARVA